jgi:RNA polymerase sigma factor for flagellar operon FliA
VSAPTVGHLWQRYLALRSEAAMYGDDEEQREELARRVEQLRDRLVVNYAPMVKYVAGFVWARVTGDVDRDEFVSWGFPGLLDAVETFDPGRGARFETYAMSKIRWSILDEYRKADSLTRRQRTRVRELEHTRDSLGQRLRRTPTDDEVAREAGMDIAGYRSLRERQSHSQVASLEARLEVGESLGGELRSLLADRDAPDPQVEAELGELRTQLVQALGSLNEQERMVATFYYYEGLTLKEIGKAMSLTEGRISQILRRALTKLRALLSVNPTFSGF